MRHTVELLSATLICLALVFPSTVLAQAELPTHLEAVIDEARASHANDYHRLKALEDLVPGNYLKARVQRPTAVRAIKRLRLHEGVLLEALLRPSLELVAAQTFPPHIDEEQQQYLRSQVMAALQMGAAYALTHQKTPHVRDALTLALEDGQYQSIHPALCVLYGRVARDSEGVARLSQIAKTTDGLIQESAIIGLGKTRQLKAFEVLHELLSDSAYLPVQKTVLHAMGHLADKAAQKANPLPSDARVRTMVTKAILSRIDKPSALPHEDVALTTLMLVTLPSELSVLESQMVEARARQVVKPGFARIKRRSVRK